MKRTHSIAAALLLGAFLVPSSAAQRQAGVTFDGPRQVTGLVDLRVTATGGSAGAIGAVGVSLRLPAHGALEPQLLLWDHFDMLGRLDGQLSLPAGTTAYAQGFTLRRGFGLSGASLVAISEVFEIEPGRDGTRVEALSGPSRPRSVVVDRLFELWFQAPKPIGSLEFRQQSTVGEDSKAGSLVNDGLQIGSESDGARAQALAQQQPQAASATSVSVRKGAPSGGAGGSPSGSAPAAGWAGDQVLHDLTGAGASSRKAYGGVFLGGPLDDDIVEPSGGGGGKASQVDQEPKQVSYSL